MALNKRLKHRLLIPALGAAIVFVIGNVLFFLNDNEININSKITNWDVNATLEDDGDLHVVDTIKFESDGFHFFEYEIGDGKNIVEGSGKNSYFDYDSIKVSVYDDSGHYYFDELTSSTPNSGEYYKYDNCVGFSWNHNDVEHDGYPLHYYTDGYDKELVYVYLNNGLPNPINLKYEYTIKNALNKYDDVSELNWNFASPLESIGVENVSLTLNLPAKCSSYTTSTEFNTDSILAYGHGNVQSEFVNFSNTKIQTKTEFLKENWDDKLELRVLIPNKIDVFPNVAAANKISASRPGYQILEEEENRLHELDQKVIENYKIKTMWFVPSNLIIAGVCFAIIIFLYYKFDKERTPKFDAEYLREPPSKILPSALSYLVNEKEVVKETFNATLISLIRKKYITIDSNGAVLTDEKANYRLTRAPEGEQKEELNDDERFVLNLLFDRMFKDTFTMEDLDRALSKESMATQYETSIENWQRSSAKKASKLGYFDDLRQTSSFGIFGIIGMAIMFYFLLTAYVGLSMSYLNILFPTLAAYVSILLIQYSVSITRKSKEGIEEYSKWMAFKKFLTDFSHFEDYDMMSVIMWEEYLVYASVFGIADLVEKQIRIKLKDISLDENVTTDMSFGDFYIIVNLNRINRRITYSHIVANKTISVAKAAAAASKASSGGSGGFGGSSSFGGGGHGGRAG